MRTVRFAAKSGATFPSLWFGVLICLIPATMVAQLGQGSVALPLPPLPPLSPTDSKACSDFRQQLNAWAARIASQHQDCLDAHSKDPGVSTPEDRVCSRPSCQWLHTQMMNSRKRVESDASDCEARVERYRAEKANEAKRREEARKAEEAQREDAERKKREDAERRDREKEQRVNARDAAEREQARKAAQREATMRSAENADRARAEALEATNRLRDQQAAELRNQQQEASEKLNDRLGESIGKITDVAKSLIDAAKTLTQDGSVASADPEFDFSGSNGDTRPDTNDPSWSIAAGSALDAASADFQQVDVSQSLQPSNAAGITFTTDERSSERGSQSWTSNETRERLTNAFNRAIQNVPLLQSASEEIDAAFGPLEHARIYASGSLREVSDAAHDDAAALEPNDESRRAMQKAKELTGGAIDRFDRAWSDGNQPLSDDERLIEGDPSRLLRDLPYVGTVIQSKERFAAKVASAEETAKAVLDLTSQAYQSARGIRREIKGWVRNQWQTIWAERPRFDDPVQQP